MDKTEITLHEIKHWGKQKIPLADPDAEIRGGDPGLQKNFFSALWASFWSKNKGGLGPPGPSPGSATESTYSDQRWYHMRSTFTSITCCTIISSFDACYVKEVKNENKVFFISLFWSMIFVLVVRVCHEWVKMETIIRWNKQFSNDMSYIWGIHNVKRKEKLSQRGETWVKLGVNMAWNAGKLRQIWVSRLKRG